VVLAKIQKTGNPPNLMILKKMAMAVLALEWIEAEGGASCAQKNRALESGSARFRRSISSTAFPPFSSTRRAGPVPGRRASYP
jgi:hypothetical protein